MDAQYNVQIKVDMLGLKEWGWYFYPFSPTSHPNGSPQTALGNTGTWFENQSSIPVVPSLQHFTDQ